MATKLPYVVQPGSIAKILAKIAEAKTPERFTQDYLATKLGFPGGNQKQFIPLAKKLGLLNSDGTPSDLYKKLRNPHTSKAAMAEALKKGYSEIFERNEYAGNLAKEEFRGLVVEITGLEANNRVVQLVCQTFDALKSMADFDAKIDKSHEEVDEGKDKDKTGDQSGDGGKADFKLGLSYTINLVLPKTDDPAVFNAIFRSLRDNLLKR